jgi:hypothetical protein
LFGRTNSYESAKGASRLTNLRPSTLTDRSVKLRRVDHDIGAVKNTL